MQSTCQNPAFSRPTQETIQLEDQFQWSSSSGSDTIIPDILHFWQPYYTLMHPSSDSQRQRGEVKEPFHNPQLLKGMTQMLDYYMRNVEQSLGCRALTLVTALNCELPRCMQCWLKPEQERGGGVLGDEGLRQRLIANQGNPHLAHNSNTSLHLSLSLKSQFPPLLVLAAGSLGPARYVQCLLPHCREVTRQAIGLDCERERERERE